MHWMTISPERIQMALSLENFDVMGAQRQMAPTHRILQRPTGHDGSPRLAAVLALLFPGDEGTSLVLMRRTERPGSVHSGQISFPGGRREGNESFSWTALRETQEELGVQAETVHILGELTHLYVPPSDSEIHPFVGYVDYHPTWLPQTNEVAEVIEMPLYYLLDKQYRHTEQRKINDYVFDAPYFAVKGHKVWGATAIMLAELAGRLHSIIAPPLPAGQPTLPHHPSVF